MSEDFEEKMQPSHMNSSYAALKETPPTDHRDDDATCGKRLWTWLTSKRTPTVAETISMLQQTRLQLELNMNHCRRRIAKHEEKMRSFHGDQHTRTAALREFRMVKHYRERHDKWHAMCANLETVESEIQAQQQTIAVFGAFTRANDAMGELAERVDMSSLCDILDTLRDRMQEGKDMSDAMTSAFDTDADDADTLEREFDAFMTSEQKKIVSIQEGGGESLQPTISSNNNNNNHEREGERAGKKNLFFCLFVPSSGGVGGVWGVFWVMCERAPACWRRRVT